MERQENYAIALTQEIQTLHGLSSFDAKKLLEGRYSQHL